MINNYGNKLQVNQTVISNINNKQETWDAIVRHTYIGKTIVYIVLFDFIIYL